MKHYIFTIRDGAAEAYLPPFVMPAAGMAQRAFQDSCNDKQHAFHRHPDDYTLFQIGTFDDSTGEIVYTGEHKSLGNGVEFLKRDISPNQIDFASTTPEDIQRLREHLKEE